MLDNLPSLTELHLRADVYQRTGGYQVLFGTQNDFLSAGTPIFLLEDPQSNSRPIAPLLTRLWLEIRGVRDDQRGILTMLQHCPSLRELHIVSQGSDEGWEEVDQPVDAFTCTLHRLQELSLYGGFSLFLLHILKAPALRRFSANSYFPKFDLMASENILDFLTRSNFGAPIRYAGIYLQGQNAFNVNGGHWGWEMRLLEALPEVKHLTMYTMFPSSGCNLLSLAADGGKLCPNLEKISMKLAKRDPDPEAVVRMLSSRFGSCEAFRAIVGVSLSEIEMAMRNSDELKGFVGNGQLDIRRITWGRH